MGLHADIGSLTRFRIVNIKLAKKFPEFSRFQYLSGICIEEEDCLDIRIKTIYVPLTILANIIPYIGSNIKELEFRSLLVVQ